MFPTLGAFSPCPPSVYCEKGGKLECQCVMDTFQSSGKFEQKMIRDVSNLLFITDKHALVERNEFMSLLSPCYIFLNSET